MAEFNGETRHSLEDDGMPEQELISIIIPIFNGEKHLKEWIPAQKGLKSINVVERGTDHALQLYYTNAQ